jgi:hypothetical protein
MIYKNWSDINSLAVRQQGQWAVYINNGLEFDTDQDQAIWNFVLDNTSSQGWPVQDRSLLLLGGLFFFDTELQATDFYRIFEQPLTDSSAIYACLYDSQGACLTENT